MRRNPGPGKFIVIEGLDGAGTTTQAELLGERLARQGPVWVTQEPTDRPAGLLIRRILHGDLVTDPRVLALLFAADRVDHIYRPDGILARLQRGEHVISDRYYLSSLAYQTLDASFSWVYHINSRALRPDLTLFLEVPVLQCLERMGGRQGEHRDLFEQEEALERVRNSYYTSMERLREQEIITIIDGCVPIERVAELAWGQVQALLETPTRELS
jgi:dTMP kinase